MALNSSGFTKRRLVIDGFSAPVHTLLVFGGWAEMCLPARNWDGTSLFTEMRWLCFPPHEPVGSWQQGAARNFPSISRKIFFEVKHLLHLVLTTWNIHVHSPSCTEFISSCHVIQSVISYIHESYMNFTQGSNQCYQKWTAKEYSSAKPKTVLHSKEWIALNDFFSWFFYLKTCRRIQKILFLFYYGGGLYLVPSLQIGPLLGTFMS